MAARNPQTMAKRAREQELKERRERKAEKKAARAASKHLDPVEVGETDALSELPPDSEPEPSE